ncbi:MAG: response regulator [Deltaproteobacteria bacterium]|jgi:signal transduction histidine kinase/ActR/RegA family two-component response regulator|nr:response regulator [Deltaproteobacteria bacterium]
MSGVDYPQLLRFARELQRAVNFSEMLTIVREAVVALTGYQHCWLGIVEPDQRHARIIFMPGNQALEWDKAQLIPVDGDPMMQEILRGNATVVVEDARTDPRTNKEMAAILDSRTIINAPLSLLDAPLGTLGVGTFGDEGVRPPTEAQLHTLIAIAGQTSVAAGRLQWLEERATAERERLELNRRLAQSQKLESLGLLAGGLAHDFNNILQVVLSHANFIGDGPLSEVQRSDLQNLTSAAERGAALTRQLLAMGRRQPQTLDTVDLNERLQGLLRLLGRVLPANLSVDLIEGQHLPTVLADGGQLDQVFLNLCLNARDAMPDGGRLTLESELVLLNGAYVRAHPWAKPGRYVLVTVTDTGTGMPPEVLERVFEPFFSTKRDQGNGLGLAVAYGIVQQHQGMMHAYSEVGVGSSFKVYLPAYERGATTVGPKLESAVRGGKEKILVAEDDPQVRRVIRRILENAGYEVHAVNDGQEAVEAVQAQPNYDLIVLDAMMPRLSGRQAYEQIKAQGTGAHFLFSSGYSADLLPPLLLAEAGIEVLQKPYDPDRLLRAVRSALDRHGP